MNTRRTFLRTGVAAGSLAVAAAAGLLSPRTVLAAWPEQAFKAKKLDLAMQNLIGSSNTASSEQVSVTAPDIAENGAVVSVTVKTSINNPESISLFVPVNTFPLSASYELTDQFDGYITGRIKMAKTADVIAVVKANGKLYTAKKKVKVTLGGCGG